MQITNLATVSVDTTAGGTLILTLAQAQSATAAGMNALVINPSVEIALVDAGGSSPASPVTGAVVGTSSPRRAATLLRLRPDLLRRLAARAAAAAAAHAARAKGRRDNRRLLELDEHILRDIGATRDSLYR